MLSLLSVASVGLVLVKCVVHVCSDDRGVAGTGKCVNILICMFMRFVSE